MAESQNIEWKRSWKDEYLKWVCGFANAQGGTLIIGKDDQGIIVAVPDSKRLLEEIPNKIKSHIGLTVDVNLRSAAAGDYFEIEVSPQSIPVSLRGRYYYRAGSTNSELTGASLNEFLLNKSGSTWDASIEDRATLDEIDPASLEQFLADARKANRLPRSQEATTEELLDKLRLRNGERLTCAALVLFGKDPAKYYPGASIRIGRFGASDTDLRFQEVIEGSLIHCLRETLLALDSKFLIKPIRFEGIQRIEDDQYPLPALREALLNALVHRRYQSGVHVQIRVYDERLVIWNDGPLPEEIPLETLLGPHASRPRNPLIADVCFKAGYIDSWGRGIEKIATACSQAKLPDPLFEEADGGMRVTLFARTEKVSGAKSELESGPELALSRHQVEILRKCLTDSSITELMLIIGRRDRTKFRNQVLRPLLDARLLEMTLPDKPTSRLQKYRLTSIGKRHLS